jgi:hypothetical protein
LNYFGRLGCKTAAPAALAKRPVLGRPRFGLIDFVAVIRIE